MITLQIDGDNGYSLTYGDYKHGVCTVAHALMEHGLQKGDVMALCSPNGVHQGVMLIAIQAAGGVPSTMNPAFTIGETVHSLIGLCFCPYSGAAAPSPAPMFQWPCILQRHMLSVNYRYR